MDSSKTCKGETASLLMKSQQSPRNLHKRDSGASRFGTGGHDDHLASLSLVGAHDSVPATETSTR